MKKKTEARRWERACTGVLGCWRAATREVGLVVNGAAKGGWVEAAIVRWRRRWRI